MSADPDPEQQALQGEARSLLEESISSLPPLYVACFVMREVEGLDTAETAECLEVSEDVVKTRLRRSRALLRHALLERAGVATAAAFSFHLHAVRPAGRRVLEAIVAGLIDLRGPRAGLPARSDVTGPLPRITKLARPGQNVPMRSLLVALALAGERSRSSSASSAGPLDLGRPGDPYGEAGGATLAGLDMAPEACHGEQVIVKGRLDLLEHGGSWQLVDGSARALLLASFGDDGSDFDRDDRGLGRGARSVAQSSPRYMQGVDVDTISSRTCRPCRRRPRSPARLHHRLQRRGRRRAGPRRPRCGELPS